MDIITTLLTVLVLLLAAAVLALKGTHRIQSEHVGLVYRRVGVRRSDDRYKVRIHGSPGPQAPVLEADHVHLRPRPLFHVEEVPQTYVPPGTIGVVVAKAGAPPPTDRVLCRHIECNLFQDGRAFLASHGQMGRQPAVLPGGARYDINPWLFDVVTTENIGSGRHGLVLRDLDEIEVEEGFTGVVITLDGEAASTDGGGQVGALVPGHASFQDAAAFLANGGQRGAQQETLGPGTYRINPWFARVGLIPSLDLILEWTQRDEKPNDRYDAALDQIRINVEGHWFRFDVSQTIRIPANAAPRLVGRFGEDRSDAARKDRRSRAPVQRFVERVLGRTVEGYFHETASSYRDVMDFVEGHEQVRLDLEDRVRQALAEWGVEAGRTTLASFEPEDPGLDEQRRKTAEERQRRVFLEKQHENQDLEDKLDERRIARLREQEKLAHARWEELIRLFGREVAGLHLILSQVKDMNVPAVVGSGGDSPVYLPLPLTKDLMDRFQGLNGSLDVPKPGAVADADATAAAPTQERRDD